MVPGLFATSGVGRVSRLQERNYNQPEVDRIWSIYCLYKGSVKDDILSTPGCQKRLGGRLSHSTTR